MESLVSDSPVFSLTSQDNREAATKFVGRLRKISEKEPVDATRNAMLVAACWIEHAVLYHEGKEDGLLGVPD